jgi:hypothetical protein
LSPENENEETDFYGKFFSGKPTPAVAVPANFMGAQPPPSKLKVSENDSKVNAEIVMGGGGDDDNDPSGPLGNRAFRRRHGNSRARSYRDFYYENKMGWQTEDRDRTLFQRRAHVRDYLEGLHWNLNYYHNGCVSWNWFFPHMYSPLSTDMVNLGEFYDQFEENEGQEFKTFPFDMGKPFPSLAQLLSVLPPQSAGLLPKPLAELMLHPSSPLIPYYPPDFVSDPNGKRQSWEAVVQIPFIEADVLLDTVDRVLAKDDAEGSLLTPAERRRNKPGERHFFIPPGGGEQQVESREPKQGRMPQSISKAQKGAARAMDANGAGAGGAPKQRRSPKATTPPQER